MDSLSRDTLTKFGSRGVALPTTQEMLRYRGLRPGTKRMAHVLLALTLIAFFIIFYQSIGSTYLDLVDSFVDESQEISINLGSAPFLSQQLPGIPCNDESGWIEEWISSGVMPRCTLTHKRKIDIIYTFAIFRYEYLTGIDG